MAVNSHFLFSVLLQIDRFEENFIFYLSLGTDRRNGLYQDEGRFYECETKGKRLVAYGTVAIFGGRNGKNSKCGFILLTGKDFSIFWGSFLDFADCIGTIANPGG